ncbi:hypothetical protein M3Y97_00218800 [Aphelenchoides bicaudatus]|nr:hypothetical protein M3Y97_00218800 [Aphelenchoides bicaudatus]
MRRGVSMGFEEFCLDDKAKEERKRAKSLAEPISVFTTTFFLPQSSSPSPKSVDTQKQCYSPSTNQILRGNLPYSNVSVSPTPSSSPSRSRIMRSMSPISVRQISKRRFTATGSGMESDSESSTNQIPASNKRQCLITQRSAASPLVRDSLTTTTSALEGQLDVPDSYRSLSPASVCSNSSSIYNSFSRPKLAADLSSIQSEAHSSFIDDNSIAGELPDQFLNMTNENSSTAFSSRTPSRVPTPFDEQMIEENDNASSSVSQSSPMRQSNAYNAGFGIFGRDSSLPPPSPLASKSTSLIID